MDETKGYLSDKLYKIDPISLKWEEVKIENKAPPACMYSSCLDGGYFYMFGGKNIDNNTCLYRLDLKNFVWSRLLGFNNPRAR